jgi:hypothetical protein
MINLAGRDIMHSWGKFVFTAMGLGLLIGVTLSMAGIYRSADTCEITPMSFSSCCKPAKVSRAVSKASSSSVPNPSSKKSELTLLLNYIGRKSGPMR